MNNLLVNCTLIYIFFTEEILFNNFYKFQNKTFKNWIFKNAFYQTVTKIKREETDPLHQMKQSKRSIRIELPNRYIVDTQTTQNIKLTP